MLDNNLVFPGDATVNAFSPQGASDPFRVMGTCPSSNFVVQVR